MTLPRVPIRRRAGEAPPEAAPVPATSAVVVATSPPTPLPVRRVFVPTPALPRKKLPTRSAPVPPQAPAATAPAPAAKSAAPPRTRKARPPPTPPIPPKERKRRKLAARIRREERCLAELAPREADIVAELLAATSGGRDQWPTGVHLGIADKLGVPSSRLGCYLAALRRTIGLPTIGPGPAIRSPEWICEARRTGDYGVLTPLRPKRPHDSATGGDESTAEG